MIECVTFTKTSLLTIVIGIIIVDWNAIIRKKISNIRGISKLRQNKKAEREYLIWDV